MAYIVAHNILSPLGVTSRENYLAVRDGRSELRSYTAKDLGVAEPATASLIADAKFSSFEQKAGASVNEAISQLPSDFVWGKSLLILSSTKGDSSRLGDSSWTLGDSAHKIADMAAISTEPIVVSNACISGLSAIILACRLVDDMAYDTIVVCGIDEVSPFVTSGFQSLKALSPSSCRPFDMERNGLNLGEAAATVIISRRRVSGCRHIADGVVSNDAYHLTSPSRTADGQTRCLTRLLEVTDKENIGFVNLHGTATFFNDQMESIAIRNVGLSELPANALKGYFGHTLGAAGVLETIVSLLAAEDGVVLATRGFEQLGVSGKVNLSASGRSAGEHCFIKMLSGFGGCNAAVLIDKGSDSVESDRPTGLNGNKDIQRTHRVRIMPESIEIDGIGVDIDAGGGDMLTAIYKQRIGDYPKFYKMDGLSRLGFIASELLLRAEGKIDCPDRAVIMFNRTSTIETDRRYIEQISDSDNFYPSPSLFIYTLPNIVTGEIAIRNGWHGETAMYVMPDRSEAMEQTIVETTCRHGGAGSALAGWIDYPDGDNYCADLSIYEVHR